MPKYSLPQLPYPYDALEPYIDAQTMEIHHTKHHQAYVDKLNAALEKHLELFEKPLEELLKDPSQVPEDIRQAVINHGGGHHNHSLFWTIMAPNSGGQPSGALAEEINQIWGGFEKFKEQFTNASLGIFGSGWAWLDIFNGKLRICTTANQNSLLMEGKIPILGIDMWEHAMYLKFQNRKSEYIAAWWNVVNWKEVESIFSKSK
ncbi:MAG: superoxide dismutase, Fe-Mn family [Parcubacteria group bacterium Gr01-1014_44]|nr:MAG: superoxide dismutase, Fe-Mn family [Parcubacteria group bacterium Gr01-1014_44]